MEHASDFAVELLSVTLLWCLKVARLHWLLSDRWLLWTSARNTLHMEKLIQNCNYLERRLQIIYCCLCTFWCAPKHNFYIHVGLNESHLDQEFDWSDLNNGSVKVPCGQVCIWRGAHQKQTKQTAFNQLWTNLFVVRRWSKLSQTQLLKRTGVLL